MLSENSRTNLPERGEFVMIDNLLASIAQKTSYKNYRIVVIDNGNSSPAQLSARRAAGIETITYSGPSQPFNYAHKCNFSVRQVMTEHVVIMNDDMEIIDDGWLAALHLCA